MHGVTFLLAGLALSINAQATSPAGSIELGQTCSDSTECKNGAQCWGTTADTIRACGNFNAACDNDSQCAFNTCSSNGLCSGFLDQSSNTSSATSTESASSSTASTASLIVGTPGSQPSGQAPITAPAGSLDLGETCSDDRQCKNGANCWGSTAFTIRSCGNFNAACTEDSQCAFNTCSSSGLCNGFLASTTTSAFITSPTGGSSAAVNGSTANATGGAKPSPSSAVPFEGSASGLSVSGGVVAVLLGVAACFV